LRIETVNWLTGCKLPAVVLCIDVETRREPRLKIFAVLALMSLSACSWFHARPKGPAPLPELIVTGAPAGSAIFIDDVQNGQVAEVNGKPQVLSVPAGMHVVEVRAGSTVIYREQTYVGTGNNHVNVLSGIHRE
jgi:hypothetical protein